MEKKQMSRDEFGLKIKSKKDIYYAYKFQCNRLLSYSTTHLYTIADNFVSSSSNQP